MIQIRKFDLDEKIYDPELGDGISSTKYIFEHYYNSKNPEDYFISFTEIDKLGINPQSKYETPLGIYTYPVKEFFETYVAQYNPVEELPKDKEWRNIGRFAPFAGEHRWVWVVEIDRSKGKVFDIAEYNPQDYREDKEKLKDIMFNRFNPADVLEFFLNKYQLDNFVYNLLIDDFNYTKEEVDRDFPKYSNVVEEFLLGHRKIFDAVAEEIMEEVADSADHKSNFAGRMWNITRLIANRNPVRWNKLFRQLDYICAVDREGLGVIHEMEKTQAVFFQRKYFNVVDKVENIEAAKTIDDVPIFNDSFKEKIEYKIEKIFKVYPNKKEMITNQLVFILKEVAQKPIITPSQANKAANALIAIFMKVSNKYDYFSYSELKDILMGATSKLSDKKFSKAIEDNIE